MNRRSECPQTFQPWAEYESIKVRCSQPFGHTGYHKTAWGNAYPTWGSTPHCGAWETNEDLGESDAKRLCLLAAGGAHTEHLSHDPITGQPVTWTGDARETECTGWDLGEREQYDQSVAALQKALEEELGKPQPLKVLSPSDTLRQAQNRLQNAVDAFVAQLPPVTREQAAQPYVDALFGDAAKATVTEVVETDGIWDIRVAVQLPMPLEYVHIDIDNVTPRTRKERRKR